MAASLRASTSSDSKPSRRGHDKAPAESSRRRDSWSRRPRGKEQPAWRPQHSQLQQRSQLLSPMSTPNTSTPSLIAVEPPRPFAMERTPSGDSIISDNTYEPWHNNTFPTCTDKQAAGRVENHIKRVQPHGTHERILRRLIESHQPIEKDDRDALDSVMTAADALFFGGKLKGRVGWDWSHPSEPRYKTELIGTTALRHAQQGGYETLIVLSDPILNNPDYDRRLLLSTFLHELIHCYLFILCGFDARMKGGHTKGFHVIAGIIDKWVGPGYLRLCNMKANLNHFRDDAVLRTRRVDPRLEMTRHRADDGCN